VQQDVEGKWGAQQVSLTFIANRSPIMSDVLSGKYDEGPSFVPGPRRVDCRGYLAKRERVLVSAAATKDAYLHSAAFSPPHTVETLFRSS
jgi:hypothetical protein